VDGGDPAREPQQFYIQSIFDPLTRDTRFHDIHHYEFGVGLAATAVIVALVFWRCKGALIIKA
jgi:hypothetical protein